MILRETKVAFNSEVPIVDNEISNDISAPKGQPWKYEEGDIISCAILYNNKITVFFREHNDDIKEYKVKLKEFLDKLPTMYAFNYMMEKGNFKGFLGKSYFIEEIKAFKGKGKSKQWFTQEVLKMKPNISKYIPQDCLEDDSREVIERYNKKDYESIIQHNISDVVKQYFVWKNRQLLVKKFSKNIDENGWWIENAS